MIDIVRDAPHIATADGVCRSFVFHPAGAGPWPAVLLYMDGIGIRPALLDVGARLATLGYYVLLPDLYYRAGPYSPMDAKRVFSDPDARRVLLEHFLGPTTSARVMADTASFLAFLEQQTAVQPGAIAITGYCMGGRLSLIAAGTYPDRIAAAASYHGGRLADDADDSPHLLAPRITARVYVAGATDDATFPDDMKHRLVTALRDADVEAIVETYPARHGWVFHDTLTYDEAACERHWTTLSALLADTVGGSH
jgi:carboxymethylenebutenolidase